MSTCYMLFFLKVLSVFWKRETWFSLSYQNMSSQLFSKNYIYLMKGTFELALNSTTRVLNSAFLTHVRGCSDASGCDELPTEILTEWLFSIIASLFVKNKAFKLWFWYDSDHEQVNTSMYSIRPCSKQKGHSIIFKRSWLYRFQIVSNWSGW